MSVDTKPPSFGFSDGFDSLFLNDLYGDDMVAAAEVFEGSGTRIAEAIAEAKVHLSSGERDKLRRAIHRVKPVFGYTGLTEVQDAVGAFESRCLKETDMTLLSDDFRSLEGSMREASARIADELERLKAHVNRNA